MKSKGMWQPYKDRLLRSKREARKLRKGTSIGVKCVLCLDSMNRCKRLCHEE